MRLPAWLLRYACHPLLPMLYLSVWSSLVTSQAQPQAPDAPVWPETPLDSVTPEEFTINLPAIPSTYLYDVFELAGHRYIRLGTAPGTGSPQQLTFARKPNQSVLYRIFNTVTRESTPLSDPVEVTEQRPADTTAPTPAPTVAPSRPPNFGQEFTRRVSISSAAIQYMVESEPGTVRCQADNVDSLELIHVASGRIVTNNSSAPQTLTVAESIILPTVQGDDGQKYICRGNNSVVNVFNQTTIELSVAKALDIFRTSYNIVAPGQSVLLQCCVKDNRRRAVKSPISWEWMNLATSVRAQTYEPYILVNNVTAPSGNAVVFYSCTSQSLGYRDYRGLAQVVVSGAPAPQTGRYSNMLQNDLCTETSLPNTESPMVSIPEQRPEVTYPSTVTTTLADIVGVSTSIVTNSCPPVPGKVSTWIIIGAFGSVLFMILVLASVFVLYRKLRKHNAKVKTNSPPGSVFVPSPTEDIVDEEATQPSITLTPNDAYGLRDESNDSDYSYVISDTVASTTTSI